VARILLIDDHPEQLELLARSFGGLVRRPDDVDEEELSNVDLFVVDFVLNDWPGRDRADNPLLQPLDGRALVEVIRSHAGNATRPVGFVLTTGEPDRLANGLGAEKRESVLARLNNLEWVIAKDTLPDDFARQVSELAAGIELLPAAWPDLSGEAMREVVCGLLGLEEEHPWADVAWDSIFECHPPIHDLSVSSHGLAFLRWLAHRIIPYPTFLIDELHLSNRLGLTVESLRAELTTGGGLSQALAPMNYRGMLGALSGRRWWRSGVEFALWEWTEGDPFSRQRLFAALQQRAATKLVALPEADAVVCLDEELRPGGVCTSARAVRVQPDDWPAFAEPAWAAIELLDSGNAPYLRSLVLPLDEPRLSAPE
jgi:hypothetical protein